MTTRADDEYLFTSESVTEGHPDKMADQISDGVLDACPAREDEGFSWEQIGKADALREAAGLDGS